MYVILFNKIILFEFKNFFIFSCSFFNFGKYILQEKEKRNRVLLWSSLLLSIFNVCLIVRSTKSITQIEYDTIANIYNID